MRFRSTLPCLPLLGLAILAGSSCEMFRDLGKDLKFMDETAVISGQVTNAASYPRVYAVVADWDPRKKEVAAADYTKVGNNGVFGFFVESKNDQALAAFSDRNNNERYDPGEPAWFYTGPDGKLAAVEFQSDGVARVRGALSSGTTIPPELITEVRKFIGGRTAAEAARGWDIPIALGEIAQPDDPKFGAERGSAGLWQPATFVMDSGIGIYFLEKYDPNRTPVLFVYGAAGSPQDWKAFAREFDQRKYQLWFYYYPSGRRLEEMAAALNRGVTLLQHQYGFRRLHVVAHSMGGLLSRDFIIKNVIDDDNDYITRFVSISTPWAGHEAAGLGVKRAPKVVPSWRDMAQGSDFQKQIFRRHLKGKVEHLLMYGHKASKSMILPTENDGTVSVPSQTAEPAVKDAVKVIGFDEDHVSILSNPQVIRNTEIFLGGGTP